MFSPASKARLTDYDLGRFPDDTLFHRLARAVCAAGCLPRKELYEAWEVARRVRRRFRGGRVVDLCGGHGLLAHTMLLLDETSPGAVVVDRAVPLSSTSLSHALTSVWPRLAERVSYVEADVNDIDLTPDDVVVSVHACGGLTDAVLDRALTAHARVAVVPCCHNLDELENAGLTGWMDGALAVDAARAVRLVTRGCRVWTQTIPSTITPQNRLLMADATRVDSD